MTFSTDGVTLDLDLSSKICDAIILWQAENPIRSLRVNRRIDWTAIASILKRVYSIEKSPIDCHRQWKFLAYGEIYDNNRALDDSDCEQGFLQPIEAFDRMKTAEEIRKDFEITGRKRILRRKQRSFVSDEAKTATKHMKVFVPNRIGKNPTDIQSIVYSSDVQRNTPRYNPHRRLRYAN